MEQHSSQKVYNKLILSCILVIILIGFISALPSPTIIDNSKTETISYDIKPILLSKAETTYYKQDVTYKYETDKLELNDFKVEVLCNDKLIKGISWETKNTLLDKEVKFNIQTNPCDGKLTFRQNKLETNCVDTKFGHFCDKIDYSDIENSKDNQIDKKEIIPIYATTWEAFIAVFPDLTKIDDYKSIPIYYDINYYGRLNNLDPIVTATGGTITTIIDGSVNYTIHTFTSNGSFNVTSGSGNVEVLVVAGGGAGGSYAGGGGGAGGLIYNSSYSLLAGSNTSIIIGLGGTINAGIHGGNNGLNSSFGTLVAVGGGKGGGYYDTASEASGGNGGSGGGAGHRDGDNGQVAGIGTVGQGYNGTKQGFGYAGGSGGGSSTNGSVSPSNGIGGAGGNGTYYNINGTNISYAGGGGGAGASAGGNGGLGGGGAGVSGGDAPNGVNGLGGGGGGGFVGNAGAGGSGIVIVRYPTAPSDTCTPPSINNNWNVLFSDNCTLSTNTNLGTGKLIINGSVGRFTLNANLTIHGRQLSCTTANCKFVQTNLGRLIYT